MTTISWYPDGLIIKHWVAIQGQWVLRSKEYITILGGGRGL